MSLFEYSATVDTIVRLCASPLCVAFVMIWRTRQSYGILLLSHVSLQSSSVWCHNLFNGLPRLSYSDAVVCAARVLITGSP